MESPRKKETEKEEEKERESTSPIPMMDIPEDAPQEAPSNLSSSGRGKGKGAKGGGPKNYNKLKIRDVQYQLGDILVIEDEGKKMVGKLLQIVETGGDLKYPNWPMVQLQWFYRKNDINRDLNGLNERLFASIGENELFETNHVDRVFVDYITAKGNLMSIEQYDGAEGLTPTDFYVRANYDAKKGVLHPPIEEWPRMCLCELPLNPDQMYVKCDRCEKWIHPTCANLDEEEAKGLDAFYCTNCK